MIETQPEPSTFASTSKDQQAGTSLLDAFAALCDQLAATNSKLEKRALIAVYLRSLAVEDAARAALYLSGAPFAETDPRRLQAGGSTLSKALAQLSGADTKAMHAAYRRHGDLGDAAFDLLAARPAPPPPTLTLTQLEAAFSALALARGPAPKLRLLLDLLARATPLEAKYIIKLVSGDMRTGVKQSLVEEAVAAAYTTDAAAVRHAVMLNGSLAEVVTMAAAGTLAQARMRLFHPLGFMLASPVDSVDAALARFAEELAEEIAKDVAIEVEPPTLRSAQIEDKYDGMRAQLHCGDPTHPTRVGLFSRNREDLSESFPELIEAFSHFAEPVILDGEILAWQPVVPAQPIPGLSRVPLPGHPERSEGPAFEFVSTSTVDPAPIPARALPFATLQQRLGRKRVTQAMRDAIPVIFMAFDLLYQSGDLLLDHPLADRRARLEALVATHAPHTDGRHYAPAQPAQALLFAEPPPSTQAFPRLLLAPATPFASAAQLDAAYSDARLRGNEGVMLKASASLYQPGRRGLAWLKLKRELATLDVVITAAEFGHGRRAGVLSDYTFAVRGPVGSSGEPELLNVGKAYSGLTDPEVEALSQRLKELTLEDHGSFRTVEPVILLEVAFNNITRSTRHASGYALRFPRILRLRPDKPVDEIDTLERVAEIYASQPDKPVEA
jgi:DNA ligase-1